MRFALVLLLVACSASESDRAQSQAERRQAREAVLTSDVVETAKTPQTSGRLIYDKPVELGRDSLAVEKR